MFPRSGILGGSHWSEPRPQNLLALRKKTTSVWAGGETGDGLLSWWQIRVWLPSPSLSSFHPLDVNSDSKNPKKEKKANLVLLCLCYLRHASILISTFQADFFFTPTFRFFSSPRRPGDAASTAAAEVEDKQRAGKSANRPSM